jgi:hypothetical protein
MITYFKIWRGKEQKKFREIFSDIEGKFGSGTISTDNISLWIPPLYIYLWFYFFNTYVIII